MHAEMNMNMIRVWGGSMTERPEFYNACDKYGLLVWQDLWISGDGNGRWEDPKKKSLVNDDEPYPDNHSLFLKSAIDQIKMLRNHPSVFIFGGGNESPHQKISTLNWWKELCQSMTERVTISKNQSQTASSVTPLVDLAMAHMVFRIQYASL